MLTLDDDSCQSAVVLFCVLYTTASFLSWLLSRLLQQRQCVLAFISPAIKPVDYRNEDLLLRRSLNATNWHLVANKARALYYLKHPASVLCSALQRPKKAKAPRRGASFTFGSVVQRDEARAMLSRSASVEARCSC